MWHHRQFMTLAFTERTFGIFSRPCDRSQGISFIELPKPVAYSCEVRVLNHRVIGGCLKGQILGEASSLQNISGLGSWHENNLISRFFYRIGRPCDDLTTDGFGIIL